MVGCSYVCSVIKPLHHDRVEYLVPTNMYYYDSVICEGKYKIIMFKKVMDMQQPVWDDTKEGFMMKTWP